MNIVNMVKFNNVWWLDSRKYHKRAKIAYRIAARFL